LHQSQDYFYNYQILKSKKSFKIMQLNINKSSISGKLSAPPSKSVMIRAIAAGLLCDGVTRIYNPTYCDDALAAISVAESLGASTVRKKKHIKIIGEMHFARKTIFCGESGLTSRMFIPIAALLSEKLKVTGAPALLERPLPGVVEALLQQKVRCEDCDGHLPIKIHGPLRGGHIKVDGSLSSQFISGLMFALPRVKKDSIIEIENLKSKPYIDLTRKVLKEFGIKIKKVEDSIYKIKGNQFYKPHKFKVEGDWSGAAFLLAAGAIAGEVTLENLKQKSKQADRKILELLELVGANIEIADEYIKVSKNSLKLFEFDAEHCPDLIPVAVALAAHCDGRSMIYGAERLIHKETNRADALQQEFSKMGIKIEIIENRLEITGGKIHESECEGHNDHRIAMAVAIAALNSDSEIKLNNAECVSKSYNNFFEDLKTIGANFS
jgi:3-phosphoshikimate 1-carboxyvinyltransferase